MESNQRFLEVANLYARTRGAAPASNGSGAPQAVHGSVEVIDVAAARRLRPANPVNGQMTLYHGSGYAQTTSLRTKGISEAGLDDGIFNVSTDPAVAVRYAIRYGGTSPRVGVMRIPEATFQDLFRRGLIVEHAVLGPGNF